MMIPIRNISLIGLGAIGQAYASQLAADPSALTVIADPERVARYPETLRINGQEYRFRYRAPNEAGPPADLILIAVKHYQLDQAIADIRLAVAPGTIIVSLLNGITSEAIIAAAYPEAHVLYAMCVGIDALRQAGEVRFASLGRICFGEQNNRVLSDPVRRVRDVWERAGIPYEIPEDMVRALWWKFMINVGINQTSAVLKAPYGVFQQVGEVRDLMQQAMREVMALSQQAGTPLSDRDIERFLEVLDGLEPTGKTSMLQDIEAGRKTELDYLAGTVRELGRQYAIGTPINDAFYAVIRAKEAMNRGGYG